MKGHQNKLVEKEKISILLCSCSWALKKFNDIVVEPFTVIKLNQKFLPRKL